MGEGAKAELFCSLAHKVGRKLAACLVFLLKTFCYFTILLLIALTTFCTPFLVARAHLAGRELIIPASCLSASASVVVSRRRHDPLQRSLQASILIAIEVRSVDERPLAISALRQWSRFRLTANPPLIDGCCVAAAAPDDIELDAFLRKCKNEASSAFLHVFATKYTVLPSKHPAREERALAAARMLVGAHRAGYTGLLLMSVTMRVSRGMWGDALLGTLESDRADKRVWVVASPVVTAVASRAPTRERADRLLLYRVDSADAVSFALRNLHLSTFGVSDLQARCWDAYVDIGHIVYWSSFADIQTDNAHARSTDINVTRREHFVPNASRAAASPH